MKRFDTLTVAVASVLFVFTVMSGGVAGAASSVWIGKSRNGAIDRYQSDGTYLSTQTTQNLDTARTMAVVGSAVWVGSGRSVEQYSFDGTYLSSFDTVSEYDNLAITLVPEPNTALLLGLGLSALAVRRENR